SLRLLTLDPNLLGSFPSFLLSLRAPPRSTLFPYTTLFRSSSGSCASARVARELLRGILRSSFIVHSPCRQRPIARNAASPQRRSTDSSRQRRPSESIQVAPTQGGTSPPSRSASSRVMFSVPCKPSIRLATIAALTPKRLAKETSLASRPIAVGPSPANSDRSLTPTSAPRRLTRPLNQAWVSGTATMRSGTGTISPASASSTSHRSVPISRPRRASMPSSAACSRRSLSRAWNSRRERRGEDVMSARQLGNPCEQHVGPHRLGQVLAGTLAQAPDPVGLGILAAADDDGNGAGR